jgi:2-oxoglutarate/2-oxoacid ferredoxin oxidoreductase subunit alpha
MAIDRSVKIVGQAGQGIQTVGAILAEVCHMAGLYVLAINDFESRIRGGISFVQIRIRECPVEAPSHEIDLLISMDPITGDLLQDEIVPGGLIVTGPGEPAADPNRTIIPFERLAAESGSRIAANTVAAGVALALLGAPLALLESHVADRFGGKATKTVQSNLEAARAGYREVERVACKCAFDWPSGDRGGRLMEGSQAMALGALAADCRFAAFYPMSPATGIMEHLVRNSNGLPMVVEQAEDEIAAVNMTIGASFAGVRALTATSGGGFSLMTEGLGLAAITETPLTIINAQRPGPATGLPTRTAQADLLFTIHASQDEFPRFVLAPRSIDDAFTVLVRAFHLADKYQVPVIVLVDQYLTDSWFVIRDAPEQPEVIERFTVNDSDLPDPSAYQRFEVTAGGVSPRALPCRGKALVKVCSDEHSADGHMTESAAERVKMMNKRAAKWPAMRREIEPPRLRYGDSRTLLVGWGSSEGALSEAVDLLRGEGFDVGCVSFCDLWPFPAQETAAILGRAERFIMAEQNSTAQLGQIIRSQTGLEAAGAILKYDGRPFFPKDICKGFLGKSG